MQSEKTHNEAAQAAKTNAKDHYKLESDYQEKGTTSLLRWAMELIAGGRERFVVNIDTILQAGHVNLNANLLPHHFSFDASRLDYIRTLIEGEKGVVSNLSLSPYFHKTTYVIIRERYQFQSIIYGTYGKNVRCPILLFPPAVKQDVLDTPTKTKAGRIPRLLAGFAMAAMGASEALIVFVDANTVDLAVARYNEEWLPYRRRLIAQTSRIFIRNTGYVTGRDEDPATVRERYCFLPYDILVETVKVEDLPGVGLAEATG